jgi:hypothetical protein
MLLLRYYTGTTAARASKVAPGDWPEREKS